MGLTENTKFLAERNKAITVRKFGLLRKLKSTTKKDRNLEMCGHAVRLKQTDKFLYCHVYVNKNFTLVPHFIRPNVQLTFKIVPLNKQGTKYACVNTQKWGKKSYVKIIRK